MALQGSLARRYAKALLGIAVEDKSVEKIDQELAEFATLVEGNAELRGYLEDPTILPMDKRDALKSIAEKMGLSETVKNFLALLGEKARIQAFADIRREFRLLADAHAGKAIARVTSATPLTPETEKALVEKLSKISGRSVSLTSKVDPELLGGIVAEIGGVVYDGSLKTQLRTLKERARQ